MCCSCAGASKSQFFGTDGVHIQVFVYIFGEETECQTSRCRHRELCDNSYVQPAILHAGFRSDIGIVSPLTCIGKVDEKGGGGQVNAFPFEVIGLGFVLEEIFEDALYIPFEATTTICKIVCYYCIETYAKSGEEWNIIHQSIVHVNHFAAIEHLNGAIHTCRDVQMACETVAATIGDDTQGGICTN